MPATPERRLRNALTRVLRLLDAASMTLEVEAQSYVDNDGKLEPHGQMLSQEAQRLRSASKRYRPLTTKEK